SEKTDVHPFGHRCLIHVHFHPFFVLYILLLYVCILNSALAGACGNRTHPGRFRRPTRVWKTRKHTSHFSAPISFLFILHRRSCSNNIRSCAPRPPSYNTTSSIFPANIILPPAAEVYTVPE